MAYELKSLLVCVLSGVGLWLRTPTSASDLNDAVGAMSDVNRGLNALEDHLRGASWARKLGAGLSILLWLVVSLSCLLLLIPWALVARARRDRSNSNMILLVSHDSALLGGAPQSLLTIVQGLDRQLFEPIVLTGSEGPFAERSRALGVCTFVLPLSFLLRQRRLHKLPQEFYRFAISFPYILYLLSFLPIRLIHNNSLVSPDAALAGRLLRIPTVWHFRETLQIRWWEHVQVLVLRVLAHRIVCNSQFSYHVVARHGGPSDKISMIYNCVTEQYFHSRWGGRAFRRSLGIESTDILVGCVGRVSADKGQDILVKAACRIVKDHSSVRFVFVGSLNDAEFVDRIKEMIRSENLEGRIILTGPRNDVPEVMAGLDIHVTPSRWDEPFGRVALEAMAAGAVSIVSNRGGLPEVVENGQSGLIFDSEDAVGLAVFLDIAITDSQFRTMLQSAGKERARKVFSCGEHVRCIEGLYRELLDA